MVTNGARDPMLRRETPASRPSWRTRARGPLLLVATAAAPMLLVLAVEVVLRFAGVGDVDPARASRLRYQHVFLPMMEAAERPDGAPVLATADGRLPYQAVLREKPPNGLRVFVVGGSAAAGLGFGPNVTFARQLERMLIAAAPDREVEVVNLGIVALASRQVRLIVDDVCRRCEPDLVVVYCGNNEYLELHASRFAEVRGGGGRLLRRLTDSNLVRWIGRVARDDADRARGSMTVADMAVADARVSESEIIETVRVTDAERAAVADAYEENLAAMVASARASGTSILLMTVASNWRWRGRDDLPADVLARLLAVPDGVDGSGTELLAELDAGLAAAPPHERHEWHFQRAVALEHRGRHEAAREAYRSSMNEDPHLRRATDDLARRVRAVGAKQSVPVFDTIEYLATSATDGIVGFEVFYDYVHFTPRGCLLVAAALFDRLQADGTIQSSERFAPDRHVADELAWLDRVDRDPLAIDRWLGVGDDVSRVHDRDLWKHQRWLKELDQRLAANPQDFDALVWRANADFLLAGGFAGAKAGYEAALAIDPTHPVVRDNLVKLITTRRP